MCLIVTNGNLWRSCVELRASMWYCGVDVSYWRLSDWTRQQWALHTQWASPLFAVRDGNTAVSKLLCYSWDRQM